MEYIVIFLIAVFIVVSLSIPKLRSMHHKRLAGILQAILEQGDLTGYELAMRIREFSPVLLQYGEVVIYPVLWQMEQDGILESYWKFDATQDREHKYYSLASRITEKSS